MSRIISDETSEVLSTKTCGRDTMCVNTHVTYVLET